MTNAAHSHTSSPHVAHRDVAHQEADHRDGERQDVHQDARHDVGHQDAARQAVHPDPARQDAVQREVLDLDAEVLADHAASITAWLPVEADPRRIVDLGSGTGAGTFALLDRFPEAHVTAVDASVDHLARLREKAREKGVADQVRTVEADLTAEWPDLGQPQMIWASAFLHHLPNPGPFLRQVHDVLAPGGLLAVVEMSGLPRFLPADAPEFRPGLEERCHEVSDRRFAAHLPYRGADWGPLLTAAGLILGGERKITINVGMDRSPTIGRYALTVMRRLRAAVADQLPEEDLAALDDLLDTDSPRSLLRRTDLAVRAERHVWAARRPAASGPSRGDN
ncbi:class I SAM-dependent methyltransferase [Amycolatopsis jiangsuensis]|uniref:SAM-dependent methyltransferase n=1 Tax=Amycolatopsis jiangsuensis TaxID=1181879 RepID=A0A840IW42_9PSEU|nr:class I SAM-dependent methyltransferase [Amycolatopsis jiangsuensis]MBB4685655.1 SAM-dependent methyltransferase [Amycolatopsis jiangsuensis]